MIKLYHGTIHSFEEIDVTAGKGFKDFGKGFYATSVSLHAERLALRNKRIEEKRQELLSHRLLTKIPVIVAYRYNLVFSEDTSGLNVKVFDKTDKEWLRFIVQNRRCADKNHDYDIVIGPTADAETTAIINDYYDELIDSGFADDVCEKVISELQPENLPKQFFFGSEEAIRTLSFDTIKRQVVGK